MKLYDSVIPNIEDWPIFRLSEDRKRFIEEINLYTFEKIKQQYAPQKLADLLAQVVFMERARMKDTPWRIDPPNDAQFWSKINKKLIREVEGNNQAAIKNNEDLLWRVINRYSEEIVGTFKIPTFLFARKFLTVFFSRLLNAATAQGFFKSIRRLLFGGELSIYDRFKVVGDIEHIRNLATKGTLIVVPTHFSNLDSILVGYVMDAKLGLPSFSYGAGLNLYNSGPVAYFMNRLGAYRVDRRKKNSVYLETLKAMSNLSIQRGTNTLFFPGGTRSRSGSLEVKLKMGLLGTVIEAQRANYQKNIDNKIYIVPLVMSYHFVLEGQSLIEQHLRSEGKERYTKTLKDEFYSFRKIGQYIWNFFSEDSEITLSFGKPMDIMGNFVNFEGESFDKFNKPIDIREYFISKEQINTDPQRETEYTRLLAENITERYFKENVVLSSHLVAFTAFEIFQAKYPKLNIYGLLRLPSSDFVFPRAEMLRAIAQLQQVLQKWEKQNKLKCSEQIHWETEKLLEHGVAELGIYHLNKPLIFNRNKDLKSRTFSLLYFYHNRLAHYGLEKMIDWRSFELSLAFDEE